MNKLPIEKSKEEEKVSKDSKYPEQVDNSSDKEAAENAEDKGTLKKED